MSVMAMPAAAQVVVSCSSDPNIFNTGYDAATGSILADGATDVNWQVAGRFPQTKPAANVVPPPITASFMPANVGNLIPSAWINASALSNNAQWISMETFANPNSTNGDWYYRYQFILDPTVNPVNFRLALDFYTDNAAVEAFVNGAPQSALTTGLPQNPPAVNPYNGGGFVAGGQSSTTLKNNWQVGLNTLVVQIKSGATYEGFLAKIRPTIPLCGTAPSVGISKSADASSATPDGSVTYTVNVSNTGTAAAGGTVVSDPIPAGISDFSTTCVANAGAVCPNGASPRTGALNETIATLPVGGGVTYTVTATVAANPPSAVVNTASVTPPGGVTCSPGNTAPPCTATKSLPRAMPLDLGIDLGGLPATATVGIAYSGSFACTNSSTVDATTGTSCTIAGLPAGVVVGTCSISPSNAAWAAGAAVPAGQTVTCPVSGTPSAAGTATATGSTGASGDTNAANDSVSKDIVVAPAAPSATDVLTSVQAPPSAAAGSTVSVPITFANVGSSTVPVTYRVQLPPGLTGVSCSGSGVTCSDPSGTGVVTLSNLPATLAAGQNVAFTLSYTAPAAGTPVSLTSTIGTSANEANTANNTATGTTTSVGTGGRPDVTATVAAQTITPPGDTVNVPVTFSNAGDATADGVSYTVALPANLSGVTCAPTAVCSYNSATGAVTVTGLPTTLAPGATTGLNLRYAAPASGVVQTTATVATTTASEVNRVNNSAAAKTTVVPASAAAAADVRIALNPPATATPGATVSVPVTVTNTGPQSADGVSYTLNLPAGLTGGVFCTGSGVSCSYDAATGIVTLSGLPTTLTAGQNVAFTVTYTAPAAGQVPISASVATTTSDPDSSNNSASGGTAVGVADVTTTVSAPASAVAGDGVNVPVAFGNLGGVTATDPTYRVTLTGGATGVTISNGSTACSYNGGTVSGCGLPAALAPGQSVNLTVSYIAPAAGSVGVSATITTSSAETDTANNTSTGATSIAAATMPDMAIALNGLPVSAAVGTSYSGTFTCINSGSAAATAGTLCTVSGLPAGVAIGACKVGPAAAPWVAGNAVPAGQTVTCSVAGTPTAAGTSTIAGATNAAGDTNSANNTASKDVAVGAAANAAIQPIPTLSEWGVISLSNLILLIGMLRLRRRGKEALR